MKPWIFNCQIVSQIVSENLDHDLSLSKRMGMRIHLAMCRLCRRYKNQLEFIRQACRYYRRHNEQMEPAVGLSEEAKQRIRDRLVRQLKQPG